MEVGWRLDFGVAYVSALGAGRWVIMHRHISTARWSVQWIGEPNGYAGADRVLDVPFLSPGKSGRQPVMVMMQAEI